MDVKDGDNLWFNELEEVDTKKMKIRRRIKKLKDANCNTVEDIMQID